MGLGRALLPALVASALGPGLGAAQEEQCSAGAGACSPGAAAAGAREHPWPYARGRPGAYGVTHHRAPRNLSASLAWVWHDPKGRFGTVLNGGLVIDDELNLYTAAVNGIHKLSPNGLLLWTKQGEFSAAPVLVGDALYGDSKDGKFFALDLRTGLPKWENKVSHSVGPDCHSVGVSEGVMVSNADGGAMGGSKMVLGLNASTGSILWNFKPDSQLWNIMPMFTGNGTVLFQDQVGRAYHLDLFTGKPIWKAGTNAGWEDFWTDGMSWLGPNGIFYVVHVDGKMGTLVPDTPSDLRAIRVSDGELLWRREFPYPVNSQPVVARLREGEGFSLVMCSGLQAGVPANFIVGLTGVAGFAGGAVLALLLGCCLCLCGSSSKSAKRRNTVLLVMLPFGAAIAVAAVCGHEYSKRVPSQYPSEVQVLDAASGELRWRYEFPRWDSIHVMGDDEGILTRLGAGVQPFCIPNGWGSPSVDASGTIFLGHQNGHLYSLRDADGNGRISESEVSVFSMGASSTHFGGAYAPGMMAWTSCDSVFVFKE